MAYRRGLRTIAIARSLDHGFFRTSGLASLQWAREAGFTVVGPSVAWCQQWANGPSGTCRVVNGNCRCGLQSEVDALGFPFNIEEGGPGFYEIDERQIGNGKVFHVIDTPTTEAYRSIIEDIRSQVEGGTVDLFVNWFFEWHNMLNALVLEDYSPQMLLGYQGGVQTNWAVPQGPSFGLEKVHGYWAIGFGQWHSAMSYSDPVFGSNAEVVALWYNETGVELDYGYGGGIAAAVVMREALRKYADTAAWGVNSSVTDKRESFRMAIGDMNDETMWGPVRFNRNNQNNGRGSAAWQILPDEQSQPQQLCVAPAEAAESEIMIPFASWESRLGCAAGKYNTGYSCISCPPGQVQGNATPGIVSNQCQVCPQGMGGFDTVQCTPCPPGRSQDPSRDFGVCRNCSSGEYASLPGAHTCSACPPGRMSPDEAMSNCSECTPGRFAELSGATECTGCEPGQYQSDAGQSSQCNKCSVGSYSEVEGASSCESCGAGRPNPEAWATMMEVATGAGNMMISYHTGADDVSTCTCDAGYRFEGQECVRCVSELECRGMDQYTVLPGYAALDGDVNRIFRCGLDQRWCPGGEPGLCAAGREGIQCGECKADYMPGKDGECVPCGGSDTALFITVVLIAFIVLCVAYHVNARADNIGKGKAPLSIMLVVTTGGQLLILTQMTGVLASFSVEWDEPFATFLAIAKVLSSFNFDILRVSCVTTLDPLATYVSRVAVIFLGITAILVIFVFHTILLDGSRFKEKGKKLIVSLGGLSMGLFISVVATLTAPLQCVEHPCDEWTVRTFPTVLCSGSDGSPWMAMLMIALGVSLLPLGLISLVSWIVWSFPSRMRRVDTGFFELTGFLFFCYRVETYWFCLIVWFRNLMVALVPILPDTLGQIIIFNLVVLGMFGLVAKFSPWRAEMANYLDMTIYVCVLGVNGLAIGFASPNTSILSTMCLVFIVIALAVLLLAAFYGIAKVLLPRRKQFEFFISHHKAAAGAFARLLKIMILETKRDCEVFIDADNLTSLDLLFDTVATDVENISMVSSAEFMKRPWCVGELTVANVRKVKVYPVYMSEFKQPDADFIDNYVNYVPDMQVLAEQNITLESVQGALRWFNTLAYINLPESLFAWTLDKLLGNILACRMQELETETPGDNGKARKDAEVKMAADDSDFEAMATCRILCKLLQKHGLADAVGQNATGRLPEVLADTSVGGAPVELSKSTTMVVLVLTNGCFQSPDYISIIHAASRVSAALMPVVGNDSFRFPSPEFYNELESNALRMLAEPDHADRVVSGVFSMFKRIAPLFESKASQSLLDAQSGELYKKIKLYYMSGQRADADWEASPPNQSTMKSVQWV